MLPLAVDCGCEDLAGLITHGADVNGRCVPYIGLDETTALQEAFKPRRPDLAEILLAAGATPLTLQEAWKLERHDLVGILLPEGATGLTEKDIKLVD